MKYLFQTFLWGSMVLTSLFSCTSSSSDNTVSELSLDGNWKFVQEGKSDTMEAEVPGTVHTDLMANGVIEDPYYRLNELDVQWIDKEDWVYVKTFNITEEQLSAPVIDIVFEGLDTYADVWLNDEPIISADNMFVDWKAAIKSKLKSGQNELKVHFYSPTKKGLELLKANGFPLPADNDQSERGEMGVDQVSPFVRKAPYHFGWDWGPRLVTSGIYRSVHIDFKKGPDINHVTYNLAQLSDEKASLNAEVEIEAIEEGEATVYITNEGTVLAEKEVNVKPGLNTFSVDFDIDQPKLWWTNGLGDPYLYNLEAKVTSASGYDKEETRYGIRTIELVTDDDDKGTTFYFKVNGVPVFMKGANHIPNDIFIPRISDETYEFEINSAKEANMNMLRIWGGGIYEQDKFYELCDENGILVWQDFMFACSMYPGDSAFLNNVRKEAIYNVRMLQNHASIALWCGNNEIDVAWAQFDEHKGWGWKQRYDSEEVKAKIWKAYKDVFHGILPEIVEQYDPARRYWPSSPFAKLGEHVDNESTAGDMHYWGVWHGKHKFEDFGKYVGRFMSEYGFQSFPIFESVKKYTKPEDWDIESEVMSSHQRSGIGNPRIREYMSWYYPVPEDFEQFLYVGQVLQGEAIKTAMETHRRHMPYCMGSLYWQINDCWPVASWSGIDYYKKWKALHYLIKKACAPIALTVHEEEGVMHVTGVSDKLESSALRLTSHVLTFTGDTLWTSEKDIELPANSATPIQSITPEMYDNYDHSKCYLVTTLMDGDQEIASQVHLMAMPKDITFPASKPEIVVNKVNNGYEVSVKSDVLIKSMYLKLEGVEGKWSDNFFDVLPGTSKTVFFETSESVNVDEAPVTYWSLDKI